MERDQTVNVKRDQPVKMITVVLDYDLYLYEKRRISNMSSLIRQVLIEMREKDVDYEKLIKAGYYVKNKESVGRLTQAGTFGGFGGSGQDDENQGDLNGEAQQE